MDLVQLTCFKETVITGSVSKAAQKLGISQPAASIRLKQLEKSLNCKLFRKRHHKILLSEAGRTVFKHTLEIFENAATMLQQVNEINSPAQLSGELRIGCGPLLSRRLMPQTAVKFLKEHPKVNLSFIEEDSAELPGLVATGHIDLGLGIFFRHSQNNVKFKKLFDDHFVLIAAETFIEPDDAADYRKPGRFKYIHSQPGTIIDMMLKKYTGDFHSQVILRARNTETVCEFVRHNLGISLIPRYLAHIAGSKSLRVIELPDAPRIQFGIYSGGSDAKLKLAQEFIRILLEAREIAEFIR